MLPSFVIHISRPQALKNLRGDPSLWRKLRFTDHSTTKDPFLCKMVHYCSVPRCRGKWSGASSDLRFHSIPKNEETRKLWQRAIGRLKPLSQSMKVCSRHFKEDDYQTILPGMFSLYYWFISLVWHLICSGMCMLVGYKRLLKKYAVPSVFLASKVDAFSQTYQNDGMVNVSVKFPIVIFFINNFLWCHSGNHFFYLLLLLLLLLNLLSCLWL